MHKCRFILVRKVRPRFRLPVRKVRPGNAGSFTKTGATQRQQPHEFRRKSGRVMPELLLAVLLLPKFFGLSIGLGGAAWAHRRPPPPHVVSRSVASLHCT